MRLLGLFLAAALMSAPVFARADDTAALLAKHKAFAGWQYGDGTFTSMILDAKATYQKNGQTETAYTLHSIPIGLATVSADGTTDDSGFTGHVFWATNRNGFTYPRLGDEQKFEVARGMIVNEVVTGLTGTLKGTQPIDGVVCDVVRVSPSQADTTDIYVDPNTGDFKQGASGQENHFEISLGRVNGLLDSGDLANITFSYALMTKQHLAMLIDSSLEGVLSSHRYTTGVGGGEVEECGSLSQLVVGPITFGDPKACYSRSWGEYASDNQILVGFDFLKHFNILFDYPHAKMMLSPRNDQ